MGGPLLLGTFCADRPRERLTAEFQFQPHFYVIVGLHGSVVHWCTGWNSAPSRNADCTRTRLSPAFSETNCTFSHHCGRHAPSAESDEHVADGTRTVPATLTRPVNAYVPRSRSSPTAWVAS